MATAAEIAALRAANMKLAAATPPNADVVNAMDAAAKVANAQAIADAQAQALAAAISTTKVFYSRVPGSTYYAADGTCLTFLGNPGFIELDTVGDAALVAELDALVKSSRSVMIFSDPATAPDMQASIDALQAAARAVAAGGAVIKSGNAVI